ncbi:hypothetical protein BKA81DRAFT_3303 [Phyllosticta paracitricarpa]
MLDSRPVVLNQGRIRSSVAISAFPAWCVKFYASNPTSCQPSIPSRYRRQAMLVASLRKAWYQKKPRIERGARIDKKGRSAVKGPRSLLAFCLAPDLLIAASLRERLSARAVELASKNSFLPVPDQSGRLAPNAPSKPTPSIRMQTRFAVRLI